MTHVTHRIMATHVTHDPSPTLSGVEWSGVLVLFACSRVYPSRLRVLRVRVQRRHVHRR